MPRFFGDLRLAARSLQRERGFVTVAVLAMALGTGVNTAVFSAVQQVLLRPLPYDRPDRLVGLYDVKAERPGQRESPSPGNFLDWRHDDAFSGMAVWYPSRATVRGGIEPEAVQTLKVTPGFFEVLGVPPLVGRTFRADETSGTAFNVAEMTMAGDRSVVVSEGFWKRHFAADRSVAGRTLSIDGSDWTVLGVMPEAFSILAPETSLFIPWDVPGSYASFPAGPPRDFRFVRVIGRLRDGVGIEEAGARMRTLARSLAAQYPKENAGWSVVVAPLAEGIVGPVRQPLLLLFGATAFVLFIACVNVASLQIARASARAREASVRLALGASRLDMVRHFFGEALLLCLAGSALGILLAHGALSLLLALQPWDLPRARAIGIDGGVLLTTLAIAIVTALASALAPAFRVKRDALATALKESGARGATLDGGRQRLRRSLVVFQVAASFVLLVGAGLFAKSFARARQTSPGFEPRGLLVVRISLDKGTYLTGSRASTFYQDLLGRMRALPQVAEAAGVTALPMSKVGVDFARPYWREGDPDPGGAAPRADIRMATPDYFAALGIKVLRGRPFSGADRIGAPRVVLVNETLARRAWPGEDPTGKRLILDYKGGSYPYEIVGLVNDTRFGGLKSEPRPEIFIPHAQNAYLDMNVVLKTLGDPHALVDPVRRLVRAIDPGQPIHSVVVMEDLVSESIAPDRFLMVLLSILSAVAVVLAATGVYGVMTYSINRRRHEFGVRLALGARGRDILRLIVGESAGLAVAGAIIGIAVALVLSRLAASLLFRVAPHDPPTLALVILVLFGAVLVATIAPARSALGGDPIEGIRHES